jgi:hypothetical protein
MPNDYCTVAEIKAIVPDSGLDDVPDYDSILKSLITRASRLFDSETNRAPGAYYVPSSDETTRYYMGSGGSVQRIDEITAAPSYVGVSEGGGVQSSDYTTIPTTDYFCLPDNALLDGRPYHKLEMDTLNGAYSTFYRYRKSVKVTAPFGYSATVPDDVKKAVTARVIILYGRGQAGFVASSGSEDLGFKRWAKEDSDWESVVDHYRRLPI